MGIRLTAGAYNASDTTKQNKGVEHNYDIAGNNLGNKYSSTNPGNVDTGEVFGPPKPTNLTKSVSNTYGPFESEIQYDAPTDGSNKNVGNTYRTASGKIVVPKVGFSGTSGSGSFLSQAAPVSGISGSGSASAFMPVATQGSSGLSGSGGSAFTGLLGGAGGLSTPALTSDTYSEDEAKPKKEKSGSIILDTIKKAVIGGIPTYGPLLKNGVSALQGIAGTMAQGTVPQVNAAATTPFGPTLPANTTPLTANEPVTNAADIVSKKAANTPMLNSSLAASLDDRGETEARLQQEYQNAYDAQTKNNPTGLEDIPLTEAQQEWLQQQQDPNGASEALRQFKASQAEYADTFSMVTETKKQIRATQESYQKVLDEVKVNPNLPKALATRRLEAINKSLKDTLQGRLNQLEDLNDLLQLQEKQVNMNLGIYDRAVDANKQAREYALETLDMLSKGAIGGMTDQDLQQFASTTGMPLSALKEMRTVANTPQVQIEGTAKDGFYQISIDKRTGKVVTKRLTSPVVDTNVSTFASLPSTIQTKVWSTSEKIKSDPIVTGYASVIGAMNVINGISPTSKNPADHQQIVYAFAKALDPQSAVKEGEYAVVKKYAQSMISRYGKEFTNAIAGTGFLSQKAITDIQTTINNKYTSLKPQYDALMQETARKINNIAGKDVAEEVLTDYTKGATQSNQSYSGQTSSGLKYTVIQN